MPKGGGNGTKKQLPLSLFSESREQRNTLSLGPLQRVDGAVTEIVGSATHATVYRFGGAWEREAVEGPLFVVRRSTEPRHRMVILNRLSPENLIEDVDENFQVENVDSYLIFRHKSNAVKGIRGLWFHSPDENSFIAHLLERLAAGRDVQPGGAAVGGAAVAPPPSSVLLTPALLKPNGASSLVKPLDPALVKAAVLDILDDPDVSAKFYAAYAKHAGSGGASSSGPGHRVVVGGGRNK